SRSRDGLALGRALWRGGWSWSRRAPQPVTRDPDEEREHCRADDRAPGKELDARLVEPAAGVPDEVPDAAEHVVDQGPAEHEQHEAADDRSKEAIDCGERLRARANRDQPPGKEYKARRERRPGDAMGDRHHHGEHRPVNLEMRRKRPPRFPSPVAHGGLAW